MSSLTNGDEVIIDSAEIKNQFVTHINFIFNVDSNYFDNRLIEDVVSNVVDDQVNIMHISIHTPNEVHGVVFAMNSISSPGPRGFRAHLFQTDWEIINDDVIKFVDFFNGWIHSNWNSNNVVVIPKCLENHLVDHYNLIALVNLNFKLSLKLLLTNWLL